MLECPGYREEWSSTVGHTVELSESVWLVVIVKLGVSGLRNRSYCSQWLMVPAATWVLGYSTGSLMAGRPDCGDWWLPVISWTVGLSKAWCFVELGGASYSDKHPVALLDRPQRLGSLLWGSTVADRCILGLVPWH